MIYWDLLLKSEDPGKRLRELYESATSILALANYLGVSKNTLQKALDAHGIKTRKRGGPHPSYRREHIPENAAELTATELAKVTGYTKHYAEKLLTKLRKGDTNETKAVRTAVRGGDGETPDRER